MVGNEAEISGSTRLSLLAVASIVLGVLGFATLWIIGGLFLAAGGAVLGHLALHDIRLSNGKHTGKKVAQTGLVISYLAMVSFVVIYVIAVATVPAWKGFEKSKIEAKSKTSRENAFRLFMACEQFSRVKGRYPRRWLELEGRFLSEWELESLLSSPYPDAEGEAFELIPHERPVLKDVAASVVVIQEKAPGDVERVAIVYANGKVDLIENPDTSNRTTD